MKLVYARAGSALVAGGLSLFGCTAQPNEPPVAGATGVASQGVLALQRYGCGACHHITGVAGADGIVGPPLVDMGRRVYIGRGFPNTSQNMIRWIRVPQEIAPRSAMPDMQVTAADAKAITTYLRGE